jgi:hypothetical protein
MPVGSTQPSWSEAIAVGFKARFPFGFEREFNQRLAGSVGQGGNAQWPLLRRPSRIWESIPRGIGF